jgi:hypothetical protein
MTDRAHPDASGSAYTILYDEPHEAHWFRNLHPSLRNAREVAITDAKDWECVRAVLLYDRPDIVLLHENQPILVVEETVEVPSGHNVGQRFARIAAAAEAGVPCLYFGPYVAKKHGGDTAGPRYVNVRLFQALEAMERMTGSTVTTINWPVDSACEVRRDAEKDSDVREFVRTVLENFQKSQSVSLANQLLYSSSVHTRMVKERNEFVRTMIQDPDQYDSPPASVMILSDQEFSSKFGERLSVRCGKSEAVVYNVGMTKLRADPYTGMAMLYRYLYVAEFKNRALVLWFPHISVAKWRAGSTGRSRKDIRLFSISADAIVFADQMLSKSEL